MTVNVNVLTFQNVRSPTGTMHVTGTVAKSIKAGAEVGIGLFSTSKVVEAGRRML